MQAKNLFGKRKVAVLLAIDGVQYRRKFTGETFDSGNGRSGRQHEYLSGCG